MNDWKTIRLGDVCEQIRGVSYKPADLHNELDDNSVILLRANNIFGDTLNYDELVYVDNKKVSNSQYLKKGDILICASSGSKNLVGKAACLEEDRKLTFGAFCKVLRTDSVNHGFFKHYFFSPSYRSTISSLSAGANINNIRAEDLDNLLIPLPPLEEQKHIAAVLDKCTALIAKHKLMLEKYDTLIKSRFIEIFGDPVQNPLNWEISNLGNFIENANNGMARRGNDKNGKIVLRLVELQRGFIDYSDCNRIAIKTNEEKYLLKNNDFLFARVNGNPDNVGRCSYYKDIGEEVYHNDHIIRVHFDENRLNEYYLNTLLNSEYGKSEFKKYIKTSAGQYTIAQDGISSAQIPIPPIELQNNFAAFVQQIDKSKFAVQKSLEKAETLYKSLMQEYFG